MHQQKFFLEALTAGLFAHTGWRCRVWAALCACRCCEPRTRAPMPLSLIWSCVNPALVYPAIWPTLTLCRITSAA